MKTAKNILILTFLIIFNITDSFNVHGKIPIIRSILKTVRSVDRWHGGQTSFGFSKNLRRTVSD